MNEASTYNALIRWIKDQTGIETTESSRGRVELAVQDLSLCHRLTPETYVGMLLSGRKDSQELIDQITTAESYFLRHRASMSFVVDKIVPDLLKQRIKPRFLSVGCARGEEPYSLAMMLMDAGIHPEKTSITGIDISATCVNIARTGTYDGYSLRRVPQDFLTRHFTCVGEEFQVNPTVKDWVGFQRMNALVEPSMKFLPGFHVIFCQNLLIYFDRPTATRLLGTLDVLLSEEGWLFVDCAEGGIARETFERHPAGNMFGFRKRKASNPDPVSKIISVRLGNSSSPERGKETGSILRSALGGKRRHTRVPVCKKKKIPLPDDPGKISRSASEKKNREQNVQDPGLSDAEIAYRAKDLDRALRIYMQISAAGSRFSAKALLGMARIHADQGNVLEALEYSESALTQNKQGHGLPLSREEKAEAHAILGLSMHQKGLVAAAYEHFLKLRSLDPHHPALRLGSS